MAPPVVHVWSVYSVNPYSVQCAINFSVLQKFVQNSGMRLYIEICGNQFLIFFQVFRQPQYCVRKISKLGSTIHFPPSSSPPSHFPSLRLLIPPPSPLVLLTPAKAYITIAIRLWYDYDTTIPRRIRLRRKWSKLRFAFDSTAIRLRHDYDEKLTCSFFACIELEAGARDTSQSDRSRIVESQLYITA